MTGTDWGVIVNGLVAVGTIWLAIVAVSNIRMTREMAVQERKYRHLDRAAILAIVDSKLDIASNSGLVQSVQVTLQNVGFGPAFNCEVTECRQGASRFTLVGDPSRLHLGVGDKATWRFKVEAQSMRHADATDDLSISIVAGSMFLKSTEEVFVFAPDLTMGGMAPDQKPEVHYIDLGIPGFKFS